MAGIAVPPVREELLANYGDFLRSNGKIDKAIEVLTM